MTEEEVPFYARQTRMLFANNGRIDPKQISDYIRAGGYAAVAKVLGGMTPEKVVETVTKSGLRGRGGAGFPTGVKWSLCRANGRPNGHGEIDRYIICNADEGDPGAFMDRACWKAIRTACIEGMVIARLRDRRTAGLRLHPRRVSAGGRAAEDRAAAKAAGTGLLGDNILGSGLRLRIGLVHGRGRLRVR